MFPQNRSKYHMFLSLLVSAVKLHPFLLSRSHLSSSVQLCFERVVIFTVIVWFHRTSPPSLWSREELTKLSDPCCKPQSGQDLSQSHLQDSSLSLIPIHILPAPSCNWNKFMSAQQIFWALLRRTQGHLLVQADLRALVLVETTEARKQQLPKVLDVKCWMSAVQR